MNARICRRLTVWLALTSAVCSAARTVTVEELGAVIGAAAANHRSDEDTARRIAGLELSQRITEDKLAALQSRAPGPRTARTLEELMERGAFLNPPADEVVQAAPPSLAEQKHILQRTAAYVVDYARRLPNLICTESIVRFDDNPMRSIHGLRALGRFHLLDTISGQLTYSKGNETLTVQAVNGRPPKGPESQGSGTTTKGEFGSAIISLVVPRTGTKVDWSHWEVLHGGLVAVFHYAVAAAKSQYSVSYACEGEQPESITSGYEGFLFVEAGTGTIVRVTLTVLRLPPKFPTREAQTAIEYGPISIGGHSYILPIRSVAESDNPAGCDRFYRDTRIHSLNEIRFSNYRLFQTESNLIAGKPEPQHNSPPPAPIAQESVPTQEPAPQPALPQPTLSQPTETAPQLAFSLPQPPPFAGTENISPNDNTSFATHATFRERLSIVTVPVVVRDAHGEAVGNLTKDDFELRDNGKSQVISSFVEQRAPQKETAPGSDTSPSPGADKTLPDRYVAYVFDDIHLEFGYVAQTRAAAERVLSDLLDPGTRIAILTTSGKVRLGFTNNRDKIITALNRVQPSPIVIPHSDCPDVSYYLADKIVNQHDSIALQLKTVEAIEKCGVDPRIPQLARRTALDAAQRSLAAHDYETRATLDAIRAIALAMSVLPGERSMVLVSPGFYLSAHLPGIQEVIDRAARSGLRIDALDARGLYVPAGFDAEERGSADPTSISKAIEYEEDEQQRDADPLDQLVDATGGRLFRNSNDYDAGFKRLSERPAVVYLLGFSPADSRGDGRYHKLKVSLTERKGLQIQARRGYVAEKPAQDAAKEEIRNALWSRDDMRDIPMAVTSAVMESSGASRKLKLLLHVDAKQIEFQKQQGRNRDKLTLTLGFFDADGSMLTVEGEDLPLDFSDGDLQARLVSGLNLRFALDVKPGSRFLRLVLRDAEGQMSTLNQVIAQ